MGGGWERSAVAKEGGRWNGDIESDVLCCNGTGLVGEAGEREEEACVVWLWHVKKKWLLKGSSGLIQVQMDGREGDSGRQSLCWRRRHQA